MDTHETELPLSYEQVEWMPSNMRAYRSTLLLFFGSGFSALVFEILWLRQLTLVFGNTVQATATVLAAFMGGLALGAWGIGVWMDRSRREPLRVFAVLEAGAAVFALFFPLFLHALTPLYGALYRVQGESSAWLTAVRFVSSFAFIVFPTALMGGTLPVLAKHVVARQGEIGMKLGSLYGVNTLGGVAGTVLCGFLMIPVLGVQGTNLVAIAILLAVAATAWWLAAKPAYQQQARPPALQAADRSPMAQVPTGSF